MNAYRLRYISGSQDKLHISDETTVEAASLTEALRGKSSWPIEKNIHHTSAWAKNPGTSLYYIEAWEAEMLSPSKLP